MTHEEKITYMKIASAICNFGFTYQQLDLLVSMYDLVVEKEGKANLVEILKIQARVEKEMTNNVPAVQVSDTSGAED